MQVCTGMPCGLLMGAVGYSCACSRQHTFKVLHLPGRRGVQWLCIAQDPQMKQPALPTRYAY